MEKQRTDNAAKSFKRLLKLFSLAAVFFTNINYGFSQQLSANEIRALRIQPVKNQNFYTKSDIKFEVLLPRTNPSNVILQNATTMQDVSMRTMRKTQEYGENFGTKLELWYNFEKKGTYTLPPLQLFINGRQRSIEFDAVTINSNPEFLSPRIVLVFENDFHLFSDEIQKSEKPVFSWTLGKKIKFIVCLQYAVQLVQFNWDLPKDSIFKQTRTFEIVEIKYREKRYSEELIPVAEFEWTSLSGGKQNFPKIKLTATGYNGYKKDVLLPDFFIQFDEPESDAISEFSVNNIYDNIFGEEYSADPNFDVLRNSNKKNKSEISLEECMEIARLRTKEKTELLAYLKNHKNRIEYEDSLGITAAKNEFFIGVFYGALFIFVFCLILFIIFLHSKKSFSAFLLSGLMIFSFIFFIYISIQINKRYAISKGCEISSIPEANAKSTAKIGAGNRVQITNETGNWVYINFGENSGWCKADDVIELKYW